MIECKKLQRERAKFHYDILSQTSMKGTSDVKVYFQFLPTVASSIEVAIKSIHQVIKPIPNDCDSRFEELKTKIPQVIQHYAKD